MTYEELEKYIKMRCAQILSEDYKQCDANMIELVLSMNDAVEEFVNQQLPKDFLDA